MQHIRKDTKKLEKREISETNIMIERFNYSKNNLIKISNTILFKKYLIDRILRLKLYVL